ncbi:MAG: DHHA1 domain-containing protein [Treponema sp.]|nr:DHHA1 domain-containing protein [Treponema sp.]
MYENLTEFIERHDLFIITTHDPADADGLGAEIVFSRILAARGKQWRIINASPVPDNLRFLNAGGIVEQWNNEKHDALPEQAALFMLDTTDLHNIGAMREAACRTREIFVVDHHEQKLSAALLGICDSAAASASEMAVELAEFTGAALDLPAALAAYVGIVYDTGFFAYSKTGPRTFRTALALIEAGVMPNEVYTRLRENSSTAALLLQRKALSSLRLHYNGRVASQVIYLSDFTETGALPEDTDGLVNIPLKSKDVRVSILVKEAQDGKVRCSMRSKGAINVSKITQDLGGGGHVNAAAFKTDLPVNKTLEITLARLAEQIDKP